MPWKKEKKSHLKPSEELICPLETSLYRQQIGSF